MKPCSFWSDSHQAANSPHCSTHGDRHPAVCAEELRKELDAALLQVRELQTVIEQFQVARSGWIHHCHAPEILKTLWAVEHPDRECSHKVCEMGPGVSGPGETWVSPGVGAVGYSYCFCCGVRRDVVEKR